MINASLYKCNPKLNFLCMCKSKVCYMICTYFGEIQGIGNAKVVKCVAHLQLNESKSCAYYSVDISYYLGY